MDSTKSKIELSSHQLATAEQDPLLFDKLHGLYEAVFLPYTSGEDLPGNHSKPAWQQRLANPVASIFYATSTASSEPIGLLLCVPRTHAEIGHELLHITIAAVHESARGLGVFPFLLEKVKEYATSNGYDAITICTFPGHFKKMYRVLSSNGWELIAWLIENEKVLMKLKL